MDIIDSRPIKPALNPLYSSHYDEQCRRADDHLRLTDFSDPVEYRGMCSLL